LNSDTENIIIQFLKNKIPEILGIYLFGSYTSNQMNSDSDIDIGYLTNHNIKSVERWKIQEELATKLNRDIDLIDLKNAPVVLRSQVIENGSRIYSNSNYECDNFEMLTYSLYADLNESRMQIINDYEEQYGRNPDK